MPASDYQYWLGKETAELKWVGKRGIVRRDADDKATGKGVFGRDFKLPGMLYARVMMCPYAHARIKSMDTSEAEKLPGVRAVVRYDDPMVPQRIFNPWDPDMLPLLYNCISYAMPSYALGPEAFYEGAPLGVAIAADDLDIADEAMELVKVEWEVLPFVIDIEKALAPGAPLAYEHVTSFDPAKAFAIRTPFSATLEAETFTYEPGWDTAADATNVKHNVKYKMVGTDLAKGFAAADQTLEFTFNKTETWGFSPEVLSTVGQWTDDGMFEFWQAGETAPKLSIYSMMIGIPESKFIPHAPYAGGQFGGWDFPTLFPPCCQIPVAAYLSKKSGRPVKVIFQRKDEQFAEMDEGIYNVKVGFKNDGTITAVQADTKIAQCADVQANADTFGGGHFIIGTKIPNVGGTNITAFLNKHGFGAYRCEQQIDSKIKNQVLTRVAHALGVDEGTIQAVNDGQEGHDKAWVSQFKQTNKIPDIDSLEVVLKAGKDAINFDNKFHAPGTKQLANGNYHGMCMFPNHEFSNGGTPIPPEYYAVKAMLSVEAGKIFVTGHRPDCGVDGRTGYSRVVAETIGMNLEDVVYARVNEEPSSKPTTEMLGGGGSVVFTMQAWPMVSLARLLKQKILATAAALLNKVPEDLDIVDSNIVLKSKPSNILTPIETITYNLNGLSATYKELSSEVMYGVLGLPVPPAETHDISRCVNLVEVEVDPETGGVEITNAVAVNDVGQAIGPETCEGQMYGAAIMGYSTSAIEELVYDAATGIRLNPNMIDYKIFTILDLSEVNTIMIQNRMGYGPFGCAGVGEDNDTFCSAMIVPAVFNAIGKWVDYPPTPERVLKALGKA